MATFNIVSATNIDALSGKAGADTYNANGARLTIDQDSRVGLNNASNTIMGAVTASATLANSEILVDGSKVRIIPYNSGSGNVPASNTTISQGSASGLLIGVYSALNAAATAAGAAMPASGYIKIKQWNANAYAAGALTGIGANATGADRVGWIEVVGTEGPQNWTFSRLGNPATPITVGDWFELGTTDGNRATTYQIPTNGVAQYHAGVWVENPNSAAVTSASWSPLTRKVTIEATAHGFETGDKVTISGITPSAYNKTTYVQRVDANHFTYVLITDPGTYTSGGTVAGNYEFYPATSDTMVSTNISTSALKGKFCKIDTATGLVRFGHDGTNSSGGYIPPSGRKVRMPNVFMTGATSGAPTANSYNGTLASRPRFITTGAARFDIRNASFNWGFGSITNPQYFNAQDCAIMDAMNLTNPAQQAIFNNVGFGSTNVYALSRLVMTTLPFGVSATDLTVGVSGQGSTSNLYPVNMADCLDMAFNRPKIFQSGVRGSTTQSAFNTSRVSGFDVADGIFAGGVLSSSTTNVNINSCMCFDSNAASNYASSAVYGFSLTTLSTDWVVDGIVYNDGDLPRNGLANVGSSSARAYFRNMGAYNAPLGTGLYEEDGASWSRSGTVCTVTTASPHGLTTGDVINIYRTPATATIARGIATVTVTGANTFTTGCTSTGSTSGVLSYFTTQMARTFLLANCDTVKFQNVHVRGIRTAIYGMDNTCTNIYLENCSGGWRDDSAIVPTASNLRMFGTMQTPVSQTAASSVYGTQIRSGYVNDSTVPNGTGASWTRVTTTATIVKSNHGLVSGARIQVLDSSNTGAFPPGNTSNITVIDKDTFTIGCTSTGSTSGTLDYVTADGAIFIDGNESSAALSSLFTVLSGTPVFTGAGALAMFTVGDEVVWESERYIKDFDYGENMLPQMSGGTIANFDIHYDINEGSGYSGIWKNLFYQRTGGSGSSGSPQVSMTSTTGVAAGDRVYGVGIASGAKVLTVDNATQVTLDKNNTGTVSGTLYFNQLPNYTSIPASGFKIKVKCKTITANVGAITLMRIFMRSTNTNRENLYEQQDLPTQSVVVSNGVAGTRLQIYDLTADEELYNDIPASYPFTWTDTEVYANDREIRIRASFVDGTDAEEFIEAIAGTSTFDDPELTYRLNQVTDQVYTDNAVDGSTVADVAIVDSTMRISVNTGSISWAELYAYEMYWLFTEEGIRDYGQSIEAVDQANYRVTGMLIKNITSPVVPLELTGGWGVDSVTGKSVDLMDTTGGAIFNAPDHIVSYAATASITDTDLENIEDVVEGVVIALT